MPHSFLCLIDILLYGLITSCLSIHQLMTLELFYFLVIMNNAVELTFVSYKLSGGTCISTFIFKEKGITPFYSVAYFDQ